MAFRDETEALRSRIAMLEDEVARERNRADRLESAAEEAEALRARVAELEARIERTQDAPDTGDTDASPPEASPPAAPRSVWETFGERVGTGIAILMALFAIGTCGYSVCGPAEPWDAGQAPSVLGVIDLGANRSPPTIEGLAAGIRLTPSNCAGYVPHAPQVELEVPERMVVQLAVSAPFDAVLLVVRADGSIVCDDDDGEDLNPYIETTLEPGRHRVFVGTYDQDLESSFVLTIHAAPQSMSHLD